MRVGQGCNVPLEAWNITVVQIDLVLPTCITVSQDADHSPPLPASAPVEPMNTRQTVIVLVGTPMSRRVREAKLSFAEVSLPCSQPE